jgi:UPF0755 protein
MKRRGLILAAVAVLFALILASGAALLEWDWHRPYQASAEEKLITIPKGMRAGQVMEMLIREGVVRNRVSLKIAFSLFGKPRELKAGTYRFDKPLTPLEVIEMLNRGEVVYTKVTIPEGLRIEEGARLLAEAGLGREKGFLEVASQPDLVKDLDPQAGSLEGYLFPDTYLVDPGHSERGVVNAMVKNFRTWWAVRAPDVPEGLTLHQVVTLASLVEKETGAPEERGLIAGVFFNRLRLGMPLQTDPSIIYGEIQAGRYRGFLTREDWTFASPYNTYLHVGLPPGPICSPGRAALEAVLRPISSNYLYFVSRNDGTHAFSRTLAEHNAAVQHYRRSASRRRGGSNQ